MGRRPCCEKESLNRGAWSAKEDNILLNYIQSHGQGKWRDVPHRAGLKRCGKSCRLRWLNYLRPDIKRGNITIEEEDLILRLHKLLGNRWSLIAGRLPGRTDNEIKNYWNTYLSKRLAQVNKVQDSSTKQLGESKVMNNSGTSTDSQTVIRTKAFRCTKVAIPNYLLDHDRDHRIQMAADKNILLGTDPSSSSSHLQHNNYDNHSSEFLNNFDIEDLLMSDLLLDSDSCQPNNFGTFNDCEDHDRVIGVDDDGDQSGLKQYVSFYDVVDDFPLLSYRHDDDDDQTVHFDDLLTHQTMSSDK